MTDTAATLEQTSSDAGDFVSSNEIRARFSRAMSTMYRQEVPQYDTLLEIVADVNAATLKHDPHSFACVTEERDRLDVERHGAIRVGTPRELHTLRRIFAIMGMQPVGYYDLSVAGLPVHSTAFRPVDKSALAVNPFRIFTSLLRLELIEDAQLRDAAAEILGNRNIFTPRALRLVDLYEQRERFTSKEADDFVREVIQTFKWHSAATVSFDTYRRLHEAHRLVADVVSFMGPHINHLTPRTLDIDAVQAEMPRRGIVPKDVIEGPPQRRVPILLRQTSFKAIQEPVRFAGPFDKIEAHTARFGEVEQRGLALTRKGRDLYDALLQSVRDKGAATSDYGARLAHAFRKFPDDLDTIRRDGLGFFRYSVAKQDAVATEAATDLETLVARGIVRATPITYEDFLPVSAAGIFQSNLGGTHQKAYAAAAAQAAFEEALGGAVLDEFALYEAEQTASIEQALRRLRHGTAK